MGQAVTQSHTSHNDDEALIKALHRVQAVIEFNLDGTILTANDNFLGAVGYDLKDIQGKHHRMFCEEEFASSMEYKQFWKSLGEGEFQSGEYKRLRKDGNEIWINASYNPIFDSSGKVVKVVKFASDITASKLKSAEDEGKINAISKAQAVIEFTTDGTILTANDNFVGAVGYSLDEIVGKHHRIFCEPEYANSPEYKNFWDRLGKGIFDSGEYKRITKDGSEIWINASYNPIFDASGRVIKVVKFATDVTESKIRNADYASQLAAIDKSQAVIEFDLKGNILAANDNFLLTTGYSLKEIQGKHHRMFAEPEYANSSEYREFWDKLGRGEFDAGEYKRLGKGGKEIWINASYNPIFDLNGKAYKVVKYATDLTKEKEAYNRLVQMFDDAAAEVSTASEQISGTASEMYGDAKETLAMSQKAATDSQSVNEGVQNVSASTEELSASIIDLSKSSTEASNYSSEAKKKAGEAQEYITELGRASEEIGNVIKVISSIAQQTNLLALNATIEAARAGESGKGFAVVANEVKELAKQTALATDDISSKILNVQESTKQAVTGVGEVSEIIVELNNIASTTASAVEEQSATTNEVSKILLNSKESVESISTVINNVAGSAEKNSEQAKQTLDASEKLTSLSERLQKLILDARAS